MARFLSWLNDDSFILAQIDDGNRFEIDFHYNPFSAWSCMRRFCLARKPDAMKKLRLQHVSCSVPAGSHEAVRAFYGKVLGLEEKPSPKSLASLNLVWFSVGDNEMELHFIPGPARSGGAI